MFVDYERERSKNTRRRLTKQYITCIIIFMYKKYGINMHSIGIYWYESIHITKKSNLLMRESALKIPDED